ncbi:unnamed protein product [Cuscuta campestris]|uniref:DUF4283 domain-containing protein n=1 Tax=Cuscuta campestris TaxID=132261 RepID=A0A484NIN1_9ASTE|nr:unnamed protein product [Cuscuta campestris]
MNNQGLNGIQADLDQLDLNDEETGISFGSDGSLVLQEVQDESFTLVGRLLTDKPYKFEVFKQVMASVWRPALGMQINQGEDGLIWFRFFHRKDAERILSEGPWAFDNATLLCCAPVSGDEVRASHLNWLEVWVQVHGLPYGYMSNAVLEAIGNFLGVFVKLDEKNATHIPQSFRRIRVRIDVRRPLKFCPDFPVSFLIDHSIELWSESFGL